MNKKIISLIMAAVLLVSFSAPIAFANHGGGYRYSHSGKSKLESKFFHKARFMMKNSEELGLSEEQFDKIKALKFKVKKDLIAKNAAIKTAKVEAKEQMWQDPFDPKKINPIIDRKYDLKKEKAKYLIGAIAELKGILSKEQLKQAKGIWIKNM